MHTQATFDAYMRNPSPELSAQLLREHRSNQWCPELNGYEPDPDPVTPAGKPVSEIERRKIWHRYCLGHSHRRIALGLDRATSTVGKVIAEIRGELALAELRRDESYIEKEQSNG